jgi:iron-sulfur cluster repair protein YtfE (RIC family)
MRAEQEHRNIYLLIEKIDSEQSDSSLLTEFSDILDNHIRFEERILFPHIQKNISLPEILHSRTVKKLPKLFLRENKCPD